MNQRYVLFLTLLFFLSCSGKQVAAKWAVVRAEDMFVKAYEMRHDKTKLDSRIQLYKKSCDYFMKAHAKDSRVFTLNRIENAIMACAWAENHEVKEVMQNFENEYIQSHPTETEYGDAMPPISFE